jgi:hypothetical protein
MDNQAWQDEVVILNLQLVLHDETKKAKYSLANVPDLQVAYADYRAQLSFANRLRRID